MFDPRHTHTKVPLTGYGDDVLPGCWDEHSSTTVITITKFRSTVAPTSRECVGVHTFAGVLDYCVMHTFRDLLHRTFSHQFLQTERLVLLYKRDFRIFRTWAQGPVTCLLWKIGLLSQHNAELMFESPKSTAPVVILHVTWMNRAVEWLKQVMCPYSTWVDFFLCKNHSLSLCLFWENWCETLIES